LSWSSEYWILGLISAAAFFASIVLHEMGHALVARSAGIPVRGITLFLFGGVSEMEGEPLSAGREFLMAIAGPVVSLVLAGLFWLAFQAGLREGWPQALVLVLKYLAQVNFVVFIFNMVPAFPLDGGRVLRSILWQITANLRTATYWATVLGQAFAWVLILAGVWQFFVGNFIGGMWLGLIGLFLRSGSQGGYQQVVVQQALRGEPVRHFMNDRPIVVPPSLDLQHWVEEYVYRHHRKSFPVTSNGHVEGLVTTRDLKDFPREEWGRHTVAEVMHRDISTFSVSPDSDALDALRLMQRTGSSRLLVTDGQTLVGILSLKDLVQFLQLKLGFDQIHEPAHRR
jgi:Zn-dependent protease